MTPRYLSPHHAHHPSPNPDAMLRQQRPISRCYNAINYMGSRMLALFCIFHSEARLLFPYSRGAFDPKGHLSSGDIAVDNSANLPSCKSKCDHLEKKRHAKVLVGHIVDAICAVAAICWPIYILGNQWVQRGPTLPRLFANKHLLTKVNSQGTSAKSYRR